MQFAQLDIGSGAGADSSWGDGPLMIQASPHSYTAGTSPSALQQQASGLTAFAEQYQQYQQQAGQGAPSAYNDPGSPLRNRNALQGQGQGPGLKAGAGTLYSTSTARAMAVSSLFSSGSTVMPMSVPGGGRGYAAR